MSMSLVMAASRSYITLSLMTSPIAFLVPILVHPYDVVLLRSVSCRLHVPFAMRPTPSLSRSGKTRTFKPRKDVPEGTKQYQLRKYAEATLVRRQ